MIAIQLETGKTVFLTLDEWLDMTPEKYQDLIASNQGYDIDDPFDKILNRIKDNKLDYEIPNLPEDIDPNLEIDPEA